MVMFDQRSLTNAYLLPQSDRNVFLLGVLRSVLERETGSKPPFM